MIDSETLRAAEAHLRRRDKKLGRVIDAHGPCTLDGKKRDPFHVLCSSIISQQLSSKAADTIQARVAAATVAGSRFKPGHFLEITPEALRACGLSNAKAKWLKAVSEINHADAAYFRKLVKLDDEAAIETLDALPGIGRWTAEMFLIFHELRPDILPVDDIGLVKAVALHYHDGKRLTASDLRTFGARWAPWRSVATWYMWRSLEPTPVAY